MTPPSSTARQHRQTLSIIMEKAAPVTMPCACCGEPAALVCKGCKIEDPVSGSLVGTTRYCGVPCQKKDWVRHKALCKAIKGIHSREVKTFELRTPEPQTEESPDQADKAPTCAFCHNAAVLSTCEKCEASPNSTGSLVQTTHYCSAMCKVVHWSSHKKACLAAQARRNLYRAGSALQQSYHGYCQGLVMEMMLMTGTLNANHMILYEKDSTQHTTDAIALHHSIRMSGNIQDQRGYFACLIGSDYSGKMGLAIKQHLKGTQAKPNTPTP